ncbi:MAG: AAA family ATPase, partial [Thermodesulfobacteriota bacterium]|nr:AAA family ATPase [Thermodesulfobacteriota bacterium]
MAEYDLDLREYWLILRKRKNIVIFATLLLGLFSFLFSIYKRPLPLYEANTSVKVEHNTSLTGLYMELLSWNTSNKLETQAEIIRSYPIMEKVAKRLGLIDKNLSSDQVAENSQYLSIVLKLQSQIETMKEGFTNIITITATSDDPDQAQRLASTVAEIYREENIKEKNKRVREARIFIEQQLKNVRKKLHEAEEKVKTLREENNFISIDAETNITLNQLSKLEGEYQELTTTTEEIGFLLEKLERGKKIENEDIKGLFADKVSLLFARLNSKLFEFKLKRNSLLLNFTEDHPEVRKVTLKINQTYHKMIAELSTQYEALKKRKTALKEYIHQLQKKLSGFPEKGLTLSRLNYEVKVNTEVLSLLESKYQEAMIKEAEKVEEVTIVKPALKPTKPVNQPNFSLKSFMGAIIGFILGLVIVFIFEALDTSIGTVENVEKFLEVPVVGIIPHAGVHEMSTIISKKFPERNQDDGRERNACLITHFAPNSMLAESFRTMRTNMQFISLEKGQKTILFTSSAPSEGKTTIAINLSIAVAQAGKKTLLVESDLRKPMISKTFGIDREPGLTDAILGNYEWQDTKRSVIDIMTGQMGMDEIMMTPGIDNLHIITAGSIPPNPCEILNSQRITDFISQVREEYDVIIFDSSPALATADASILGSKMDGAIIIYHVGQVARGALKRTKTQLENVNTKVLGVVLNKLQPDMSPDYEELRYSRYYTYGEEEEVPSRAQKWPLLAGFMSRRDQRGSEKTVDGTRKEERWPKILISLAAVSFLAGGLFWQTGLRSPKSPEAGLKNDYYELIRNEIDKKD